MILKKIPVPEVGVKAFDGSEFILFKTSSDVRN